MSGDTSSDGLGGVFEDLEQQAHGLHLADRDAELADRARGEYTTVSFASRVHASVGHTVALTLRTGDVVDGTLTQAGVDWCTLVTDRPQVSWLVRLDAVVTAAGMSSRALPEAARPATARLGFGSALHRLSTQAAEVVVHLGPSVSRRVRVLRIGADFVEVESREGSGGAGAQLLPFAAMAAVRAV
jgi:hypothetical protein